MRTALNLETHAQETTSSRILQVATRLFAEKGYSNVSVRDVCRETETTPPMIYYYFGSKKGLFEAAVRQKISMRDFITKLKKETANGRLDSSLASFVRIYLLSFPDNAFDIGLYMGESARIDRQSAQRITRDLDEIHDLAASLIERCIKKGIFRRTNPALAADCLLGMLNRVVFQRIHFSRASDIETYRDYITGFFFKAMK